MSTFKGCVLRNLAIGFTCALLTGAMYRQILIDMHTPFAYSLLAAVCTMTFSLGAVAYSSDHDDHTFKHYLSYGRRTAIFIAPCSFLGLLLFKWWGLGAGFFTGSLMSYTFIQTLGVEKPVEHASMVPSTPNRSTRSHSFSNTPSETANLSNTASYPSTTEHNPTGADSITRLAQSPNLDKMSPRSRQSYILEHYVL